jgi:hypothetical protein
MLKPLEARQFTYELQQNRHLATSKRPDLKIHDGSKAANRDRFNLKSSAISESVNQ